MFLGSPARRLPIDDSFTDENEYVESLLAFATSSEIFQRLCGGVHILDFLVKEPDLYSTILPKDWTDYFQCTSISDVLDLLMREDLTVIESHRNQDVQQAIPFWRNGPAPPVSLLEYVSTIRKHALDRKFPPGDRARHDHESVTNAKLQRRVAAGMKAKKVHEVQNFAQYIDDLSEHITSCIPYKIEHIVDFGSGQNYLGRALAAPPYNKSIVALESKQLNIKGAKNMDVKASLAEKERIMRNKKLYRSGMERKTISTSLPLETLPLAMEASDTFIETDGSTVRNQEGGRITYIETLIQGGDLSKVIEHIPRCSKDTMKSDSQLMVVSLHSCGNLIHHGIRSLILNPSVKAVAMVGCCYNLVTERLGPPTYKLPQLRSSNLRLDATSSACDPNGFPMSEQLATYKHQDGEGIRLNITARMMAVQAPQNWTDKESASFFTRHFYRALLQKIFMDRGLVSKPIDPSEQVEGARGWTGTGPPIIIGSLRKACYNTFRAYVRGALQKLSENSGFAERIGRHMQGILDEEIDEYEERFRDRKKDLSVVWSLMAVSASVAESLIIVDRWLYLREQSIVKQCWVETVFDYGQSPRNLVVVGIKG